MDLDAVNQAIYDEFHRITGVTNRFLFPTWFGGITRQVIAGLHEHPGVALSVWGRLSTAEQRERVFRHLRAQPPAKWPDIRLVVARAYEAEGARGQLQSILDGEECSSRAA